MGFIYHILTITSIEDQMISISGVDYIIEIDSEGYNTIHADSPSEEIVCEYEFDPENIFEIQEEYWESQRFGHMRLDYFYSQTESVDCQSIIEEQKANFICNKVI